MFIRPRTYVHEKWQNKTHTNFHFLLYIFMANEVIVYLDDYKYSGDGNFDTMYLDFRTSGDYDVFIQQTGEVRTKGSYI